MIIYSSTKKTTVIYKYNSNQVYNNKNSKTARQQKRTVKKRITTSNQNEKYYKNYINKQYRISQENLKKTITDYEIEAAQNKLNDITGNGGTNSKQFWNLVRSIKRSNAEDTHAIATEDGWRFISENDIKEQTAIYYQKLYTPRILLAYNHS